MRTIRVLVILGILAAAVPGSDAWSGEAEAASRLCARPVAIAVSVQGEVSAKRSGKGDWEPVRRKGAFCTGDVIRVMERSRADLALKNETMLRLDQNTEIRFVGREEEEDLWVDVLLGGAYFMTRTPKGFKVNTPFVNAGVEGTEFFIQVEKDKARLTVFEGRVAAANESGGVSLAGAQTAVAEPGKAPAIRVVARPRDAVQWTLYYPPVIESRPGAAPDWRSRVDSLLSVGRVDEANAEIEEAQKEAPGNADALALQAIIAVAQNEKEKALFLAQKAVDADPNSAAARIAQSYARQARFDLEGALSSLQEAVKSKPENALARARLAELLLSFGRLDEALEEAKKAAALNPGIARTQTVLGFAYLAQIRSKDSRAAFEKAIGLDQADPLPRLGLGLATIRDGDVAAGRAEIEIAASLDPNSSILRSYLGKAYYEERRDKHASSQFSMAKELDPFDPTPLFYDAIRKQTLNRPVEALHDLQKSISLNDNRAVYRSRLLLDEDLAARSASLGRIYTDLGFQQLALVEGWKSVNTDPANYSAHRFLADSYAALPRHEIARVSELLQSQLLQPININPVQPSLGQSNLFILEGAGPSSPSFNEFNPLFNRNRLALQASGVAGNNGTWGDELVVSGLKDRFSFSMGQFHFETDGFRENNDQERDIYNLFGQASLSDRTSVLAELRASDVDEGDIELRFNPDDFFNNMRITDKYRGGRVGFRHSFSPGYDFIGTLVLEYQRTRTLFKEIFPVPDPPPGFVLDIRFDSWTSDHVFGFELQQQLRRRRYNLVGGVGYFYINRKSINDDSIIAIPPQDPDIFTPVVNREVLDSSIRHANAYLYFHVRYPEAVTWTLGGSADIFKDSSEFFRDRNQFNPKAGVTWTPLPGTTLRAVVIRGLRRTLPFTSQTIEPTQVSGFNQFFDDPGGTESWRYGFAVDQKVTENLFSGAEYSQRDLDVPILFSGPPAPTEVRRFSYKERMGRIYSYWTPHPWLAFSADYLYERHDRRADPVREVKTHRIPLAVRFFHPSGIFSLVKGTYFDQEGEFFPLNAIVPPEAGSDRFWVFDASAGYRLPGRRGIASVEAKNLFDRSFRYQDMDRFNPAVWPERSVLFKITLAL